MLMLVSLSVIEVTSAGTSSRQTSLATVISKEVNVTVPLAPEIMPLGAVHPVTVPPVNVDWTLDKVTRLPVVIVLSLK